MEAEDGDKAKEGNLSKIRAQTIGTLHKADGPPSISFTSATSQIFLQK
jgi:hypothetical protein